MKILSNISDLAAIPGPVALAIGVFDGVHLGHQEVIRYANEHVAQHGGTAVVMTFDPHPLRVLRPDQSPRLLCSTWHKLRILDRLGVNNVFVCRFDDAFSNISAKDFLTQLTQACRPLGFISVGYAWRFGHGGKGDIHLLMDAGQESGFGVVGVPPVKVDDEIVSSTLVREAVGSGDLAKAARLLGREYTVLGTVLEGRKLGRQIGFPTANLEVESEQLPPAGVYAVQALHRGEIRNGVANLGRRPTVDTNGSLQLEVHLLDFTGEIYGDDLEVTFVKHLRAEQRFDGLPALKSQIERDVEHARAVFGN